jgi:endonuclease-8
VAAAHRKLLVGKSFQARSPNGRFKEGEGEAALQS